MLIRRLFLTSLSVLAAIGAPSAPCGSNGLCFERLKARFGDDTVEVGFALPPLNGAKSPKEFIAEVTFPLPYGFTAIEINTHGTDTSLSMALFNFSEGRFDAPLTLDGFVVQMSQRLGNNTLAPVASQNVPISFLSSMTDKSVTIIFRCINCLSPPSSDGSSDTTRGIFSPSARFAAFAVVLSDKFPDYLDNVTSNALLSLRGSERDSLTLDISKARTVRYEKMLALAGFA